LLTDHQLLYSPHEGCGAGPGLQNPFSSFRTWSRYTANCGSLQQHSLLTCLMMSWESPFTSSYRTPRDRVVFSPKIRASYSIMLLVALNSRCTMYLNCSPAGVGAGLPHRPPDYTRSCRSRGSSEGRRTPEPVVPTYCRLAPLGGLVVASSLPQNRRAPDS
jgi:hypothetical protein